MTTYRPQMRALAKRIPKEYVRIKPGGLGLQYVSHSEIQQMLLTKLDVPPSQRIVEVIRDSDGVVQGCILEVTYIIDGETVVIQEAGDCERPGGNSATNLQMGVSSAINRCAMRVGLGLELWSQDYFVLDKALEARAKREEGADDES